MQKKSTGSFYTPRDIVDYMVDSSLLEYLKEKSGIDEIKLRALISYSKEDDHLAVFDNQEKKKIDKVMGMYDVLPTLGNMLGIYSPYALGHDVFSIDENFVVFPNGNWITDKMYYDSQSDEGILLDENAVISADYIEKYTTRAEKEVEVSNDIIVHDLIKKTKESNDLLKENKNGKTKN